ncbi:hypothetical protein NDU88_006186 [Pleurodeles waltl]|uniref:Uncharacterized protein n=1 Tax=Pleurodeles waltl TaxID=8319 RepID=A0AAV7QK41_PLEWA|nr:hypothetical protein NDU88_006186 [Pleurodeles waltl]
MSPMTCVTEPTESIDPTDLNSCVGYVNEMTLDEKSKAQEHQKDSRMDPKRKVPNVSKTYIYNYFTRARNGFGTTGENIESTISEDNQGSWAPTASSELAFDLAIKSTQIEKAQNNASCAVGTDSSLDTSTIGELIKLADTATGEGMSMHN